MSKQGGQAMALLLNAEIASVLASMRQNSKWSLVPMRYTAEDDLGDEPLLEDFRLLRRRIFKWSDWTAVEPLEYMSPFLEVIRSPETSGPITGCALGAVRRILDKNVLGVARHGIAEAMHKTAEAITQCRFEATDPASDEVVLFKILQVLSSCVRCPGGDFLTNDNVVDIFHACFRIGHYQTERSKDMSELLTQASRQIMLELIEIIFRRLGDLAPVPLSPQGMHTGAAARMSASPLASDIAAGAEAFSNPLRSLSATSAPNADAAAAQPDTMPDRAAGASPGRGVAQQGPGQHAVGMPSPAASQGSMTNAQSPAVQEGSGTRAAMHDWTGAHHTVSVAPIRARLPEPVSDGSAESDEHGLTCAAEILGYLVSLIASDAEGVHTDLNEFGLEAMNIALNAGGTAFQRHEALMAVLQEDLFVALSRAVCSPNLACLSGSCQVALTLYCNLGQQLLLQLETFITHIVLKLAEGKGIVKIEQQEAALEGVLDFCNQLSFIRNVYLNLDCRIERNNLFEAIASLLSKTAFPVNCPLGSVHLLSLEGLFSILSALSALCQGSSSWDAEGEPVVQPVSPEQLRTVWEALVSGQPAPPQLGADAADGTQQPPGGADNALAVAGRMEKQVKQRLTVAADHFNRDYRKGFQYCQAMGLLAEPLDAREVACFLRRCPGLSKTTIGELLGEPSEFWLSVLTHFVDTFDFAELDFDSSMRMFLQSFRLPGESQKIARMMEKFSTAYHKVCPGVFKNSDAAYILSYSVIMLNTDQHNKQVKKKMTLEQFISNNRGINDGGNLPEEFLSNIYASIRRNEIKLNSEAASNSLEVSPVLWTELQRDSGQPRSVMVEAPLEGSTRLERDMFVLLWGPTVAAVSVVLDHADAGAIVSTALGGLLHAARIAAFHHVDEVMDNLVASLSRYTQLLNPALAKPAIAFGESDKARLAAEAVFTIANQYGDSLRSGWRDIMECITRLHKLGLMPATILAVDGEPPEAASARLPKPLAPTRTSSSGSLFTRAFNSLISIDGSEASGPEVSEREATATQRTMDTIRTCNVAQIFADCASLRPDSLLALARAVVWAAAAGSGADGDTDTAELCLELLLTMTLRNRDRAGLLWPMLHDVLAGVMPAEATTAPGPLVQRAALGVLRVAAQLLAAQDDMADALLHSLNLLPRLHPNVAWELAEPIAQQVLQIVRVSGTHIHGARGWQTLCTLITTTSLQPAAADKCFEALAVATDPDGQVLSLTAYRPVLEAVLVILDRHSKDPYPDKSLKALEVVDSMFKWLVQHAERQRQAPDAHPTAPDAQAQQSSAGVQAAVEVPQEAQQPAGATSSWPLPAEQPPAVDEVWLATIMAVTRICHEPNGHLRNHAALVLTGMLVTSERMGLPGELWLRALGDLVLPLVADLNALLAARPRDFPEAGKTLRMAVAALNKALLQSLPATSPLPGFSNLWLRVLRVLQECTNSRSDELVEHVPEALKNTLMVMHGSGVLVPTWKDPAGHSMWDATWARTREISSGLGPNILDLGQPNTPRRQPAPASPAGQRSPAQASQQSSPSPQPAPDLKGPAGASQPAPASPAAATPPPAAAPAATPPSQVGSGSHSAALQAAIAAAQAHLQDTEVGDQGADAPQPPTAAEMHAAERHSIAAGKSADAAFLAAAAAEPSAPSLHSDERQPDVGQSMALASDGAAGNLRTANAASVATSTASVSAAMAAGDVASSGAAVPLPPVQQSTPDTAAAVQQPPAQPGADPGGNGDGRPASAAAAMTAEPGIASAKAAEMPAEPQSDLRAEEATQQQTEEQANSTCKQS